MVTANARKSKSFALGDTVQVVATHKVAGVLTNGTACVITIEEPDGTNNTPSVTNVSTGVYRAEFVPDQDGRHRVKVATTGNAAGVRETSFYVASSGIT